MKHFNKINCGASVAHAHATFAQEIYKKLTPIEEVKLRKCSATVLYYRMPDGDTVYLLKSYQTIVAMVDEGGVGIDFLRYVYGYTATSAQHIAKFFADYCDDFADIFTYKP